MYDDRAGRTPLTAKRFRPGIFEPASGSQRKNFRTKLLGTGWGEVALPEHHKKEFYQKKNAGLGESHRQTLTLDAVAHGSDARRLCWQSRQHRGGELGLALQPHTCQISIGAHAIEHRMRVPRGLSLGLPLHLLPPCSKRRLALGTANSIALSHRAQALPSSLSREPLRDRLECQYECTV